MADKDHLSIYNIGEEVCTPSHGFGPAVRNHCLLHMVVRGKGRYFIDGKEYKVKAGEGFYIPPDIITYYEADEKEPWHYCWIGFVGGDAQELVKHLGVSRSHPVFKVMDIDGGAQLIRTAAECSVSEEKHFMLLSAFYGFLALVRGEEPFEASATLAAQIKNYIEKNYSYRINVTELSRLFCVSRSQMFRIFKAQYGMSVQEFLVDYRLLKAAGLMSRQDMGISEIMYSCGFNDLPYFSKRFKEKYKASPSEYRRGL